MNLSIVMYRGQCMRLDSDGAQASYSSCPPTSVHVDESGHQVLLVRISRQQWLDDPERKHWMTHHETPFNTSIDTPVRRLVHAEREEACDAWTEQVCEPHLNNTHTH